MTEQQLLDMPLHTTARINNTGIFVFRVVDGWIYQFSETSNCFVPEPPNPYHLPKEKEVRGYFGSISDRANDEENDKPGPFSHDSHLPYYGGGNKIGGDI